jgi:hypothetical protein
MPHRPAEISPQTYARIGGALYLIIIVAGGFAEGIVRSRLIVPGNAADTAKNIMASEWIWRLAFAGDLAIYVCGVPLVLIFYLLLSPVNRNLALLTVFFNLVSLVIEGVNALSHFAPLLLLGGADYLKVFDAHQLEALALLFLNLHAYGFGISLTIFSFVLFLEGYLIFNSGYLPKTIGVLVVVAGICYLTNSLALFLAPAFHATIFPVILIPSFIGELSLCLWLLVMGVDVTKWEETNRLARCGSATAS